MRLKMNSENIKLFLFYEFKEILQQMLQNAYIVYGLY